LHFSYLFRYITGRVLRERTPSSPFRHLCLKCLDIIPRDVPFCVSFHFNCLTLLTASIALQHSSTPSGVNALNTGFSRILEARERPNFIALFLFLFLSRSSGCSSFSTASIPTGLAAARFGASNFEKRQTSAIAVTVTPHSHRLPLLLLLPHTYLYLCSPFTLSLAHYTPLTIRCITTPTKFILFSFIAVHN
jgi:hypothetical protein